MKMKHKAAIAACALVLTFGVGVAAGLLERWNFASAAATSTFSIGGEIPSDVNIAQLWKAWNLLEKSYVSTHASSTIPSKEERLWGAIKGLTESYGDPYTVFMPPEDAKVFQEEISGAFEGVGMELGLKDDILTVIAPLKDSPAYKAGIQSGDKVLSINGTSTEGVHVDAAVKFIRGKKGTSVTLSILREGEEKAREVTIVRDVISIPVLTHELRSDGVYAIELYSFSANAPQLFRDALREFLKSGSSKLLLDLRGNPGGYLDASVDMASFFLPVGKTVVTEDFKGNRTNIVHRSAGYNVFANKNLRMAILINQGSASASEILAGALQQNNVAKLVGTRSFGKGSVQELVDLGGGANLKVTIARWLTPNGISISDGGLTPDILATTTAELIKEGKDVQKDAALKYLKGQ
ncbi:S41 family peptidase [Acetobacteraceae bacterium]|nr:S41 family peptidase [Candidatus Parcubacteria bacterium]